MANIPGAAYVLPGVYGPGGTEIIKTNKGYAIGFSSMQHWGGPWVEGTVQDVAMHLFRIIMKRPKNDQHHNVAIFDVILKPSVSCQFRGLVSIGKSIDKEEFLVELNKQLERLLKLSAFA